MVVGDEVWTVLGPFRAHAHADVVELALADFERGIDFCGVEISVDGCQFGFGLRLEARCGDVWDREGASADVDAEEFVKIRDRFDRCQVKAFPDFQVADIPP